MSTNYYIQYRDCACCGAVGKRIHLGKSSIGWTFALRVSPDKGINDLNDIISLLKSECTSLKHPSSRGRLIDEYGTEISIDQFVQRVTDRRNEKRITEGWTSFGSGLQTEEQFHLLNHSERGPNGLLRRKIDGHFVIGHGEGTWDLLSVDFS